MSMEMMTKAFKIKVGNPLRKLILIKLADNASDLGECWPSYQHIADQCEISKRSVMAHIEALCEMGLVRKEYRSGPKGNSSNLYHLKLGGAGDSLGGSAGDSLPSAARSPGSAGDSLGGSAGDSPRISHSLEPVKESVSESKSIGTPAKAAEPSRTGKQEYSTEFEEAWQAYPKRAGGNPKPSAWRAWSARIREGIETADMLAGIHRYAAYITATGKAGSEYVKQAATFLGPDHHFAESWTAPPSQQRSTPAQNRHSGFSDRNYGTTSTPSWSKGSQ